MDGQTDRVVHRAARSQLKMLHRGKFKIKFQEDMQDFYHFYHVDKENTHFSHSWPLENKNEPMLTKI